MARTRKRDGDIVNADELQVASKIFRVMDADAVGVAVHLQPCRTKCLAGWCAANHITKTGASCTATLRVKCALPAIMLETDAGLYPNERQADGNTVNQELTRPKSVHSASMFVDAVLVI